MEEELTIKITDPVKGESGLKKIKPSELADLAKRAGDLGLEIEEYIDPSVIDQKRAEILKRTQGGIISDFEQGLLAGVSRETQDELRGIVSGTEAQDKAELRRRAAEEQSPLAFGTGKVVGGLLGSGAPIAAGAARGAKIGKTFGPYGAAIGGLLGGGAVAAGLGGLEAVFEQPQGKKELNREVAKRAAMAGVLAPLLGAGGSRVGGKLTEKIAQKLAKRQQFDKGALTAYSKIQKELSEAEEMLARLQRKYKDLPKNVDDLYKKELGKDLVGALEKRQELLKELRNMKKVAKGRIIQEIAEGGGGVAGRAFGHSVGGSLLPGVLLPMEELTEEEKKILDEYLSEQTLREQAGELSEEEKNILEQYLIEREALRELERRKGF